MEKIAKGNKPDTKLHEQFDAVFHGSLEFYIKGSLPVPKPRTEMENTAIQEEMINSTKGLPR